jgi:lactate dehydrogenase-like 2-hydroxyacid dehydrogenase
MLTSENAMHAFSRDRGRAAGGESGPIFGTIVLCFGKTHMLPGADFVIVALPLTGATRGLIGPAELARMDRGAWLINVGRGALVDKRLGFVPSS